MDKARILIKNFLRKSVWCCLAIAILFLCPFTYGWAQNPEYEKATFAGGCFWCMQPPFDEVEGVVSTVVGYTGGEKINPTYQEVAWGKTKHAEAIEIVYDSSKVSYGELVDIFWRNINPTTPNRQFVDKGSQYRAGIFYHDNAQKMIAMESKRALSLSGRFSDPIVTEITGAGPFYPAEDYHQKYYLKSPKDYKRYRSGSGRDEYLRSVWG